MTPRNVVPGDILRRPGDLSLVPVVSILLSHDGREFAVIENGFALLASYIRKDGTADNQRWSLVR